MKPQDIKLLIAEDDEGFRKTICDLFSLFNFTVAGVGDGLAAWDMIQQFKYDIVISDIRMPRLSGFELLKKVKAQNVSFPKFFIITGFTDYPIVDLYDAGVDGFFSKPFDASEVRKCIKRALVAPAERWSASHEVPSGVERLARKFSEFEVAVKSSEIAFGRQGFFMPLSGYPPKPGEMVQLDFTFGEGPEQTLMSGLGRVIFEVEKSKGNPVKGVGVEIVKLNSKAIAKINELIAKNQPIASIPRTV